MRAPARFALNGNVETIGQLTGDGNISLSGVSPTARLILAQGGFSGEIIGNGGLTKVGISTLALPGSNTFSGLTIVAGGSLWVDGVLANSTVRLDGGVLTGRGRVNRITGNTGGAVDPGFGVTFQNALHSGDVSFNASTTFQPRLTSVDPGYENTYLQVAGTVSLGNAALKLAMPFGFTPPINKSFVIIDNDGSDPVVGTFAGLPEGAVFGAGSFAFRISYIGGTGNDVTVMRVPASPSNYSSIQSLGDGRVLMQGKGISGLEYAVQATSNLNPVITWLQVGRGTGDSSGVFQFIHSNAPAIPMRFYRAITP